MRALVVSPIPSDPLNQGNAARIVRICETLQYFGYHVHFVYYGLEGMTRETEKAMRSRWDDFHFVRVESPKRQSRLDGYDVDDFFGEELARKISDLQEVWRFDLALVNYVWMSAALDVISSSTFKLIDTHDVFGERQYILQADRIAPTWFFCSAEEERRGLNRADLVIAIQDEEAELLRTRTVRPVATIGHILPQNFRPPRVEGARKLRVGYLASSNPSNQKSLAALVAAAHERPLVLERCQFLVGGRVSAHLPPSAGAFTAVGEVGDPLDFYDSVDVILNPNVSGTGLKIKSVEALSYGVPFISTKSGMIGIPSPRPEHQCASVDELMIHLERVTDPVARTELGAAGQDVFLAYTRQQTDAFRRVLSMSEPVDAAGGAPA